MLALILMALTFVIPVFPTIYAQSNNEVSIVSEASKLGDKAYNPNPVTIKQGDTITWTNKDFGIHTVTDSEETFSSDDLRPDQTFEYMFDSAGTFEYHCKLHPTMVGKVIVI